MSHLTNKQAELERIAQWASMYGLGRVRDLCREAKAEIEQELQRIEFRNSPQAIGLERYS